jgi:iron complex outermembrane receptor protein
MPDNESTSCAIISAIPHYMNKFIPFRHLTLAAFIASCGTLSAQDLLSLPLEELLQLEVNPRQPYRGDAPLETLPQAVEILTGRFVQDLGISTFQDALDFAGNVVRQNSFGNTWNSFAIRGFAGDENLPGGYFVNGFSAGRGFSGLRDISNIQEIEVLKGAGAAFYGRSEPGGTINIVTKKPKFVADGYLQASMTSEDTYRLEGDYTSAATTSLALRINGAYEEGESFRDTLETKKLSLNPSLLFRFSEQSHLTYEMEILDQELPFDRGIVVAGNNFKAVSINRFYGEPDDGPIKIAAIGHQLTYEQSLGTHWNLLTGLGYRNSSLEGYSTEPELSLSRQLFFTDGTTLNRQRRYRDFDATDLSARIELSGEFQLGGLVNHLLLGVDNYEYELTQIQNIWRVAPGDITYSVNVQAPVYGQPPPDLQPFWNRQEHQHSTGGYLQNQIDLSERWKLLAGFRYDKLHRDVDNFLGNSATPQEHNKTSPRLGAVYEVSKFSSIYVNYSEGFRPNSGSNWTGDAFEPEDSRSYEIGGNFNSRNDAIKSSIAFFRAGKSNILTADPVHSGYSSTLGEAESQGVEFNLDAALNDDINVSFAYAFVDAHTSNDMTNPDWGVEIPKGSRLINIPRHKAILTFRNDMNILKHNSNTGFAITYVGDRAGETRTPDYILPSYTSVRLFSTVDITNKFQINLVIDNLFNKEYFVNSYSTLWTQPGNPRTIRLALRYSI